MTDDRGLDKGGGLRDGEEEVNSKHRQRVHSELLLRLKAQGKMQLPPLPF